MQKTSPKKRVAAQPELLEPGCLVLAPRRGEISRGDQPVTHEKPAPHSDSVDRSEGLDLLARGCDERERYERDGDETLDQGLDVVLEAWQFHFLQWEGTVF